MDNKYWRAENELEEGFYGIKEPTPYEVSKQPDLAEAPISKTQEDFTKYFYCPICGKKALIKDAIIRRHVLNKSFGLGNAAMPGWMKISVSVDACYIRVCPQCENKGLSKDAFFRAYDGNAIENRKGKIRAAENSGCMVILASIAGIASIACWMICLMF